VDLSELHDNVGHIKAALGRLRIPEPADLTPLKEDIGQVSQRILALPQEATDLSGVDNRITSLEARLDTMAAQLAAVADLQIPDAPDLGPLTAGLAALSRRFDGLPTEPVDIAPLTHKVVEVERQLHGVEARIAALADLPGPDFAPLVSRIEGVQTSIAGLPHPTPAVDLSGVEADLSEVQRAIANIRIPPGTDLAPLQSRVERIEAAIGDIVIPEAPDIAPLNLHFDQLQRRLDEIEELLAAPQVAQVELQSAARLSERPDVVDDLQQISGVGPKLEGLLNTNGIYCFWQIALWSSGDIDEMDARLEAFKGRIERDDWVTQARGLQSASAAIPLAPTGT
ncbi:MAG: hypothetical protein AAF513_19015, partial [Pseudomonadota bacterium]